MVDLDGKVQIKFKKLNDKFQPQNIQTNQVRAFMEQQALPGFSPATKLIAGYQTQNYNREIKCVAIVCPNGNEIIWRLEFNRAIKPAVPIRETKESEEAVGKATIKEGLIDEKIGVKKI